MSQVNRDADDGDNRTDEQWEQFAERAVDNFNNFGELWERIKEAADTIDAVEWQFIEYASNQKTDTFGEKDLLPVLRDMRGKIERMEKALENRRGG